MAKIGRNDPCPCGSGKKYKKCCTTREASPQTSTLGTSLQAPNLKEFSNFMQTWKQQKMSGPKASDLVMVLDHYRLEDESALDHLAALGEVTERGILLYEQQEWVAEILFDTSESLQLLTPQLSVADRYRRVLLQIPGIAFERRQKEELPSEDGPPRDGGAELLEFKVKFYRTWLDEPNEKLSGSTPRQAAYDPKLRKKLDDLVRELEFKELGVPKKHRYNFKPIRSKLGLPR